VRDIGIDEVIIESDYRDSVEDLGSLALSIRRNNLIHPIVLRPSGDKFVVDAGRRRFRALKDVLKVKKLRYIKDFLLANEDTDPRVIQFEENKKRLNFKPLEEARALSDIHSIYVKEHGPAVKGKAGGWAIKDTAKLVNMAPSTVSQYIRLWNNRDVFTDEEREDLENINDALETLRKRKKGSILRQVRQEISSKVSASLPADAKDMLSINMRNFKHMDALDYIETVENITHIITDPPYGVNLDKLGTGSEDYECYKDDKKKYLELMLKLIPKCSKVLTNGYLVIWCSFELFGWLKRLCVRHGFHCCRYPLIWKKTNTGGSGPNVTKLLPIVVECALYGWKGDVTIATPGKDNHFSFPTVKENRIHVAQKNVDLQKSILRTFTCEGDRILDLFAGSGSMSLACSQMNRECFACEKDIHNYNNAMSWLSEWLEDKEPEDKFKGLYNEEE